MTARLNAVIVQSLQTIERRDCLLAQGVEGVCSTQAVFAAYLKAETEKWARVVKDAHGNVLADGDIVAMVKDLKLGGTSQVLKVGTKSKPIRLVDGDHEISCKMEGLTIALKAMYVKKVMN